MTVAEIIELCRDKKKEYCFNIETLVEELGFNDYDLEYDCDEVDKVITQKYFDTWICWDTHVGKSVIYLNGEPICITVKPYRKSETEFYWLGKEQVHKTREYIMSLMKPFDDDQFSFISESTVVPLEGDIIGNSRSAYK